MISTLHLAFTWAVVGLIWTIHLVHYPLMATVRREDFLDFHRGHMARIGLVVGPLLLGEVATAAWLLWEGRRDGWFLVSLGLLAVAWISTAVWHVPQHSRLQLFGHDESTLRALVRTNLYRTLAWSARGVVLLLA
jgi:hypothetical protein